MYVELFICLFIHLFVCVYICVCVCGKRWECNGACKVYVCVRMCMYVRLFLCVMCRRRMQGMYVYFCSFVYVFVYKFAGYACKVYVCVCMCVFACLFVYVRVCVSVWLFVC